MKLVPTEKVWMNGDLVDWEKATIHVATHSLHYGTGVYEGIRAYATDRGPALFRLTDHIVRFHRSAKILEMALPYSVAELVEACKATVRATGLESCYVRPIAYYGYGFMGLTTHDCPVDVAIICWPWEEIEGYQDNTAGLKLKVSSWQRTDHNVVPPAAKTTGSYVTASMAKREAMRSGYQDCVLLNRHGTVAECTAENIFVVRDGHVLTPPQTAGALEGLTQNTVARIAGDLGHEIRVCELARTDLYIADEMFVCGTASEVNSVASVDDRAIPCPGPIGSAVKAAYAKIVRGQDERYRAWCEAAREG